MQGTEITARPCDETGVNRRQQMTDEEMAKEYLKNNHCNDCMFWDCCYGVENKECVEKTKYIKNHLDGLTKGRKETAEKISALEKENSELKERLKGFENGEVAWQGDMDRTIEQNLQLKEEVEALKSKMDRMKKFLPAYMFSKYFLEEDK